MRGCDRAAILPATMNALIFFAVTSTVAATRPCEHATQMGDAAARGDGAAFSSLQATMRAAGGPDINAPDCAGRTALHRAAGGGHMDLARTIILGGANVNAKTEEGQTPLFAAALNGRARVVQLLLDHGADIDSSDSIGITPLFIASQQGHVEVVQTLIDNGAGLHKADQLGCDPACIASTFRRAEVIQLLHRAGGGASTPGEKPRTSYSRSLSDTGMLNGNQPGARQKNDRIHEGTTGPLGGVGDALTAWRRELVSSVLEAAKHHVSSQVDSWAWHRGLALDVLGPPNQPKTAVRKQPQVAADTGRSDARPKRAPLPPVATSFHKDRDADIAGYFDRLIETCGKPAFSRSWFDGCFGLIQSLVRDGRCTTRADSRGCGTMEAFMKSENERFSNKDSWLQAQEHEQARERVASVPVVGTVPQETVVEPKGAKDKSDSGRQRRKDKYADERRVVRGWFRNDTLNVAIFGAGPVGLILANALLHLPQLNAAVSVRVLIFDNRTDDTESEALVNAAGCRQCTKRPYSRDWVTELPLDSFTGVVDPRITTVLSRLHNGGQVSLPVNIIETLLLLSNREKGARIIYGPGAIHQRHWNALARVPGLVAFDATGHRLDPLDRSRSDVSNARGGSGDVGAAHSAETFMGSSLLKHDANEAETRRSQHIPFARAIIPDGHVAKWSLPSSDFHVARHGNLLFPVTVPATHGTADTSLASSYRVWYLKVAHIPSDRVATHHLEALTKHPDLSGALAKVYSMSKRLRSDVAALLVKNHPEVNMKTLICNLSPAQAVLLSEAAGSMVRHGAQAGSEISWSTLWAVLEPLLAAPVLQKNGLDRLLHALSEISAGGAGDARFAMKVSIFQYSPYAYTDALSEIPASEDGGGNRFAMLRLGDSLMSGDVRVGSGLGTHLRVVRQIVRKLSRVGSNASEDKLGIRNRAGDVTAVGEEER